MVEAPHTVKSYEEELKNINSNIIKMGGFCEEALGKAIQAITTRTVSYTHLTLPTICSV